MATQGSSKLTLHELESTFGVLFIGYVVAMVLYGFTFFQTYVYFSRYHKDVMWMKLMVAGLCALDTTTSALISQALYYYLISLFPSPVPLEEATSTFCAENGLMVVATTVVQLFFASRIWTLSHRHYPLIAAVVISTLAAFAFGIAMTVHLFNNRAFADLSLPHIKTAAAASMGTAFLADSLIVTSMMYYLRPSLNPFMRPATGLFDKLVTFTIIRLNGATLIQLIYFLVFITMPTKAIWLPFHVIVSKLYINSLLTLLNSRDVHRGQGVPEEQTLSSHHAAKSQSQFGSSAQARSGTAIRFNVIDSKPTINISVTQTIEHEGQKIGYDDDMSLNNLKKDRFTTQVPHEDCRSDVLLLKESETPVTVAVAV